LGWGLVHTSTPDINDAPGRQPQSSDTTPKTIYLFITLTQYSENRKRAHQQNNG
jgi:hypothetical protein